MSRLGFSLNFAPGLGVYSLMGFFLEDVRYGLRGLANNAGFTILAVTALALGIGANATVFTLANGVLFKSMPFDQNDRILYLSTKNLSRGNQRAGVSYPDFLDWREQAKSFEDLSAFGGLGVNYSDKSGLPELYNASQMTANSFHAIGQKPVAGRDFTAEDEKRGAAPVAILGYGLWERRYGKDPSVVGRTVRLNDVPTTIIGVMPSGLTFPGQSDLWTPYVPGPNSEKRESRGLIAFGRMREGIGIKSVRTEMETIARRLEGAYPTTNQGIAALVQTFNEAFNGPQITVMFSALLGAVGFVLLIACANVANLLLARAVSRSREISIRAALGASRWRVVRQLLVESVMLSIAGGGIGWMISIWGVRTFDAVVTPLGKPAFIDFSMDYHVLVYLLAISLGTGVLFGLAPALRLSKLDVNTSLKDGGRGASGGGQGRYLSGLLVVTEMALAVVLLTGAGLMIRSFLAISRTSTGVNVANVLTMRLRLPEAKYLKDQDEISFHERLKTRLEALPGVDSVAIASNLPTGGSMNFPYELEGVPPVDEKRRQTLSALVISPDYFRVADVRALRGRFFTETDGGAGPPVTIVNQRFAERFWPGADPVGKRLRIFNGKTPEAWLTVVGLVPDILQNNISLQDHDPLIYIPYRQKPQRDMAIIARTHVPPSSLGTAFRQQVQSMDEDLPIYRLLTMEDRLAQNYWPWRVFGSLFAIFAGIALVLASVGLYAVIAHSVSQRTQEIGVRMALGASAQNIHRLVFGQGMLQLAIGLGVGLAAAFGITRILRTLLVQVSPTDPGTFITVSLVLALAAVLGCWIPARRAMSVDPVVALRNE
jgi:putative ABC transport system permease protein